MRWPFALLAFCNHKWFIRYAFVRRVTFYLQLLTIVAVLIWRIIDEVLYQEALNYVYLTGATFIACVVIGVDLHWTSVVKFYA
jgi:prepilin signal peptidase PulO-like enzyme (type II secretory pathway)